MLDNIYMLTSKMQHELSTTSAKRHQNGRAFARPVRQGCGVRILEGED